MSDSGGQLTNGGPRPDRGHPGSRRPLPERFCNLDRLLAVMRQRQVDSGLVLYLRPNVFYMSGYSSKPNQSVHETNGYGVFFLSPSKPEESILVVPDIDIAAFHSNPSWIKDVRAYASMPLPFDLPVGPDTIGRSVPKEILASKLGSRIANTYEESLLSASKRAMNDLGIKNGRVGFDDLRLARSLGTDAMEVVDAYGLMKYVRQVKTAEEIDLLRAAAMINEEAISQLVDAWQPGMTWFDLNHAYHVNVARLGGFVHDPGGVIVANPRGIEPVFYVDSGLDDFELTPGMNVMLDCHGTLNQYCWDSGKTWVVQDKRRGVAALVERATIEAMHAVNDAIRPGVKLRELQRIGFAVFEALKVPDARRASVFFHGLGLEHADVEVLSAAGRPDWQIEEGQLVATHIVYPGDASVRFYLEDNAIAHPQGGRSLYSWSYETLVNR